MTDVCGRPLVIASSPGQTSDFCLARQCPEALPGVREVIADKGHDGKALRAWLRQRGVEPVIPPRKCHKKSPAFDARKYRHRNVVERTFCRLKDFRRIATRYDKLAKTFLATKIFRNNYLVGILNLVLIAVALSILSS